jgi:peptidoglycan/LPS O-acetylase OafA/YrhL
MVTLFHFAALHHGYRLSFVRNSYLFVDFFFVLSGFVIAHASASRLTDRKSGVAFAIRRFGRVWPLHFAVLAAFFFLEIAKWVLVSAGVKANFAAFDPAGTTTLGSLPSNLTLTHALGTQTTLTWNHPSWSISAEFWTYMIFAVLTVVVPKRWRVLTMGALGLASAAILVTFAKHGIDATFDWGLFRCLFGFMLGVTLYEGRRRIPTLPLSLMRWAESIAVVAVIAYVSLAGFGALSFFAPVVFAAAVFVFSFEAGPISKVLRRRGVQRLGTLSYSIYMVHILVLSVMNLAVSVLQQRVFNRTLLLTQPDGSRLLGGISPFILDALLVVYLAVIVGLSLLTYRFIEEPGRRLFARMAGRYSYRPRHTKRAVAGKHVKGKHVKGAAQSRMDGAVTHT